MKLVLLLILLAAQSVSANTKNQTHWLYNQTADEVVLAENSTTVRPIASITKLMTAMVALDYSSDLERKLKISNKADTNMPNRHHNRLEIISAMLIRSDNAASETLAADYPGGRPAFIAAMNAKAQTLGMTNTVFIDPSGITRNISTAEELSIMISESGKYPLIRQLSTTREINLEVPQKKKTTTKKLENTNKLVLFEFDDVVVSKTGLTSIAGFCVAMMVERDGQKYIMVILGARNKLERLKIVEQLMYNHVIKTYAN